MPEQLTCPRCPDLTRVREILEPLDRLREPEGASVQIMCPNPDDGPAQAIYVQAPWTSWRPRRFEGDSLAACLAAAETARDAGEDESPKISWGERNCRHYGRCPHNPTPGSCNEECPFYRRAGMSRTAGDGAVTERPE